MYSVRISISEISWIEKSLCKWIPCYSINAMLQYSEPSPSDNHIQLQGLVIPSKCSNFLMGILNLISVTVDDDLNSLFLGVAALPLKLEEKCD